MEGKRAKEGKRSNGVEGQREWRKLKEVEG